MTITNEDLLLLLPGTKVVITSCEGNDHAPASEGCLCALKGTIQTLYQRYKTPFVGTPTWHLVGSNKARASNRDHAATGRKHMKVKWDIVGFTGTQDGMTAPQRHIVRVQLASWGSHQGHHGLCIGADEEFHYLCSGLGLLIEGHPPVNTSKMMQYDPADFAVLHPPKEYLARNRDIVAAATIIIAAPKEREEQQRGGTWYTIRQARQVRCPLIIVFPDSSVQMERMG